MMTMRDLCREIVAKNEKISELEKAIKIAKKLLVASGGFLHSHAAWIRLDPEEEEIAEKYFNYEEDDI